MNLCRKMSPVCAFYWLSVRLSTAYKRSSLCSWFPSLRENWNRMQSTAFPNPAGQWWRSTSSIFGGSCFTLKITFIKNCQQNVCQWWGYFWQLSPDTWMIIQFTLQLQLFLIQSVYVWRNDNITCLVFTNILNVRAQKVCVLKPLHSVAPNHG